MLYFYVQKTTGEIEHAKYKDKDIKKKTYINFRDKNQKINPCNNGINGR